MIIILNLASINRELNTYSVLPGLAVACFLPGLLVSSALTDSLKMQVRKI